MKNQKGITLVALVVTVVVLLILAGVTIVLVMQGDSIFGKATSAKTETNDKVVEDIVNMALYTVQVEKADPTESSAFHGKTGDEILTEANKIFTDEIKKNATVSTDTPLTSFDNATTGTVSSAFKVTYKNEEHTVEINTKAEDVTQRVKFTHPTR